MGQGSQLREVESVRLDSWKEIASFLHRDARTVRRWERDRRLPVHRVPGGERSGVFAYVAELEEWLHATVDAPEESAPVKIALVPQKHAGAASEVPRGLTLNAESPSPDDTDILAGKLAAKEPPEPHVDLSSASALHSVNTFVSTFTADETTLSSHGAEAVSAESRPAPPTAHTLAYQVISLVCLAVIAAGTTFGIVHYRVAHRKISAVHHPTAEVQDLYLRGRYNWNLRTEAGLNSAIDLFTQAIVNDPKYAPAYAGLADSYLLLRQYGHMPNSEAFPRALAATKQAIALDDSIPDAHRSLAFILRFWNWDMAAAEKEYLRAIALNPNDSQSHHWYATALLSSSRNREALEQIDIARSLEPQSVSILADRGLILSMDDPTAAVAALQELEESQPSFLSTHIYLSGIFLNLSDYQGFLTEAHQAAYLTHDTEALAILDHAHDVLVKRGPKPMLRDLAVNYAPLVEHDSVPAYSVARFYALAGEPQEAMRYLRISCDRREPGFISFEQDPAFKSVHSSPEYRTLLARHDATLPNQKEPIARLDLPNRS